jgi:hypothetical protein
MVREKDFSAAIDITSLKVFLSYFGQPATP